MKKIIQRLVSIKPTSNHPMTRYTVECIYYWGRSGTQTEWSKYFEGPTARQQAMQEIIDRSWGLYTYEISRGSHTLRIGGVNEMTDDYREGLEQTFQELDLMVEEENWTDVPLSVSQRQILLLTKQLDGDDPILQKVLQLLTTGQLTSVDEEADE